MEHGAIELEGKALDLKENSMIQRVYLGLAV